jgi:hypothetical protein
MPADALAVSRDRVHPSAVIQAAAATESGIAEYSYRVDGGLWSPWLRDARFEVKSPLFLMQGHHKIEVTARNEGDDRSQDPSPVALDFFVSIEAPQVALVPMPDGSIATRAESAASKAGALRYSYRFEDENSWSEPGAARVISPEELGGRGLAVKVFDEGGRFATAER